MRSDGIIKHEALVTSWLNDPSPELRAEAHRTLLRWNRVEWLPLAIERVCADPAEAVRGSLASDLRSAARQYPEMRDSILRALVRVVESDPVDYVAAVAYRSLRFVLLELDQIEFSPGQFDRRRDVDWALLTPFRARSL
jgi:hypothetical protein